MERRLSTPLGRIIACDVLNFVAQRVRRWIFPGTPSRGCGCWNRYLSLIFLFSDDSRRLEKTFCIQNDLDMCLLWRMADRLDRIFRKLRRPRTAIVSLD